MFLFIIGIILALLGLTMIAKGTVSDGSSEYNIRAFSPIPILLALVLGFLSCATIVEAKNVGVVTTLGKPTGSLEPGFALKAPWDKVTDIDGTIQTRQYHGDTCLWVRIGDGSRSCVSLALRWRIVPQHADTVFSDYRSDNPTEEVGDKLVSPTLKAALQKNLGDYNPVAQLGAIDATEIDANLTFAPDYDEIAAQTFEGIEERLGEDPLVEIDSLTVSYVSISDNTQEALDNFVKAVGETQQAEQQELTAAAQSRTNAKLKESLTDNPYVLVSRCFDLIASGKFTPPVGFSCWGGSEAVVVPSAASSK